MQAIAERADRRTTGGLLLARQAYYLIGFDASPETMAWLAQMYRTDRRVVRPARGWSPSWPLARSTASAPTRLGDPEPMRRFIADQLCDEAGDTTGFLYEMGLLKRYKRTGWSLAGVPSPESVADHSFRVSVIASVIAAMEGADPQRAAFLALWHDSQETRTTDIPHLTKSYVSTARNEVVTQDQVGPLPSAVAG